MGLDPALRTSCTMLLNLRFCQVRGCKHGFVGHECMLFGVRWLPDTKGEYAIAARMVDNAAGQMAVCIPMVMLGYFQPNPNPNPNPNN